MEREPVTMTIFIHPDGLKWPISFVLEDNTLCKVDKLLDRQPLSSFKSGGDGTRYTVVAKGKRSHLYEIGGKWSVELAV